MSVHVTTDARGVATVTIDNRAKLNAAGASTIRELADAVNTLGTGDDLRAVVLRGAGERAFIGGADINELARLDATSARAFITGVHRACDALRRCPVPVIARAQGYALGAGLEIAAACDLRIAGETARFGMPEVRIGLPSVVEAALLPMLVGWGRARWLVLTGEMIDAARALAWGLVEEVAPPEALDEAIENTLRPILAAGPRAIRLQKALVTAWEDLPLRAAVQRGIDVLSEVVPHRRADEDDGCPHRGDAPWQGGMMIRDDLDERTRYARDSSPEPFVARAEALLPLLRRFEAANECDRRVHPDVVDAMKEAGFFRILQSRRIGGAECDLRTMHRVVRTLATASSSASWILMVLLAHTWILGMFDEATQDEIAADDPDTIIAGSLAPTARAIPVTGGWRLTGRWPFASGCDHARWALLGVKVAGDGLLPPAIHAMVPARDYAINDNWFAMGLRGTGSKELVLDDVFAPTHRVVPTPILYGSHSEWGMRHATWLHMMPVRAGLAYHVSAPVLGLAQSSSRISSGSRGCATTNTPAAARPTAPGCSCASRSRSSICAPPRCCSIRSPTGSTR